MLWLFLILLGVYLLLYLLVPKGVLWHEMLNMPFYWMRHLATPAVRMKETRISYGTHRHQYFLLFEPTQSEKQKRTIVIYFHGGIWRFGRPWNFRVNAGFFAKRGFTVALPSHRRPPKYKFDDIRKDLNQILLTVCRWASEKKIDKFRILVAGMSSGGHLATMMLYDRETLGELGIDPAIFSGLMVCGTPLNFNLLPDHVLLRDFAGPRSGELFQIANPMNYINPETRQPILCFHGKKDGLVPFPSVLPFIKELENLGIPTIFHAIEDGNHMSSTRWVYYGGEERRIVDDWLSSLESRFEPQTLEGS